MTISVGDILLLFGIGPRGQHKTRKEKKNGNNEEELRQKKKQRFGKTEKIESTRIIKKTKYQTTGNWGYRGSGLSRPEKHRGGCA